MIPNAPPASRPVRPKPAPAAEQPRQQQPTRPRPSNRANFPKNFKVVKPTKQNNINSNRRISVVDRYTVQNDDGSFTWGYQSEDGSFKEETMGIDCVTRGRYVINYNFLGLSSHMSQSDEILWMQKPAKPIMVLHLQVWLH